MTYLTTGGTFDLSAIMTAAWARHRADTAYAKAYRYKLPTFGESLKVIWQRAKHERAEAQRKAAVASMPAIEREARIQQLNDQLERLNYLPAHMSLALAAAPLRAELASLR